MEAIKKEPGDKESLKYIVDIYKELENYRIRCWKLEEGSKKLKERSAELELEIQNKKDEYSLLDLKFETLQVEKVTCEDELKVLKRKNIELEEKCVASELEIRKCKTEYEGLDVKFKELEVDKSVVENELKVSKRQNDEHEERIARIENQCGIRLGREMATERIIDLTLENREENEVVQLMIENKVLECEKKKAEDEVGFWKEKLRESESRVVHLEKDNIVLRGKLLGFADVGSLEGKGTKKIREASNSKDEASLDNEWTKDKPLDLHESCRVSPSKVIDHSQAAGTPYIDTPCKHFGHIRREERETRLQEQVVYDSQVKKQLAFGNEGSVNRKTAPSTPVGVRPASVSVIDISDGDDEPGIVKIQMCRTPKRKRGSNIVTSDSESDNDDNVPICKLVRMQLQEQVNHSADTLLNSCSAGADNALQSTNLLRRRLVTLREYEEAGGDERNSPSNLRTNENETKNEILTTEDVEDGDTEESGSDTDGESLGGFIVDSSTGDSTESESKSDGDLEFDEIISRLQRNRDRKLRWEFEADMLADFGKDPELCMKAVCALYRQQTSDEKLVKETIHSNQRGFSQPDAPRGSALAEFLIDGDPRADLKKSVEELKNYDPEALELCRHLATRYSKQLFAIYKNKEDPLFLLS